MDDVLNKQKYNYILIFKYKVNKKYIKINN